MVTEQSCSPQRFHLEEAGPGMPERPDFTGPNCGASDVAVSWLCQCTVYTAARAAHRLSSCFYTTLSLQHRRDLIHLLACFFLLASTFMTPPPAGSPTPWSYLFIRYTSAASYTMATRAHGRSADGCSSSCLRYSTAP